MLPLIFFLVLAFIVYYAVEPEKTNHICLYAIFMPLVGIIVYLFISFVYFESTNSTNISTYYLAGGQIPKTLWPAVISSAVIFFLLQKKKKTNDEIFNNDENKNHYE